MTRLVPNSKSSIPGRPTPKALVAIRGLIPNPKSLIPFQGLIRRGINALVSAVLAPACAVCDILLDDPLSGCVCAACWRSVLPITPPVCDRCGDPLPRQPHWLSPNAQLLKPPPRPLCAPCGAGCSAVDRARAVGEYAGALREVIHALKYSGRVSVARPLAEQMRVRGRDLFEKVDCAVPVPLHWRREYQRGFNQAREIARHLGPPVLEALRRCRSTRPQIELAADRRRANVAGAFAVRRNWFRSPDVRGKILLLVDDVSTTGATLESCASVLKDHGASEVYALTAARVVSRRIDAPG